MTISPSVEYRYFVTDILSNKIISEVPFKSVSYGRANRRAGEFSGNIPFIEATKGLNLYEATMPGKTAIYVMRNEVCVWGGIIWRRSYDAISRTLEVGAAEFVSYFYHRNIWQTLQYGSDFFGISSYEISSGVATITTELAHPFVVGDKVAITFSNPAVDGNQTITAVPAANKFEFETVSADASGAVTSGACRSLVDTYDFARDIIYRISNDLGGINFANEVIKPRNEFEASVISKERSGNIVTLRMSEDHSIVPGQEVEVVEIGDDLDGFHVVTEVPDTRTIRYELIGVDVPLTSLSGIRTLNVVTKQLQDNVATITLDQPHGGFVGQDVFLDGVDAFFTGYFDATFNGRFEITGIPTPESFTFASGGILNLGPETVAGGVATLGSKIVYGTYGSFTSNSDIDIQYETLEKSGYYHDTQVLRGFENKTVGEVLEQYSNTVDGGFEYRIDCAYDYDSGQFTRTLVFIPVEPDRTAASGVYTAEELGADRFVFEYPGNITQFTVEENAEDSATRFFTIGRIDDLSGDVSQPYAAASASSLLNNPNGLSWPLLDLSETIEGVYDEVELYNYASDYLYESLPPVGTYNVSVNGSLSPVVGEYYPGDWCSLIIDDQFVRERLANDQEPRDDILIRKINSYRVSVPDNPTFPEEVELELVTDWKVDRDGE